MANTNPVNPPTEMEFLLDEQRAGFGLVYDGDPRELGNSISGMNVPFCVKGYFIQAVHKDHVSCHCDRSKDVGFWCDHWPFFPDALTDLVGPNGNRVTL